MTNPLLLPQIIQKVFSYLDVDYVHGCRLVCATWYQEANHYLTKCPRFDIYYYSGEGLKTRFDRPTKDFDYGSISAYLALLRPSSKPDKCNDSSKWPNCRSHAKFSGSGIKKQTKTPMETAKALMIALKGGPNSVSRVSLIFHTGCISRKVLSMIGNSATLVSIEIDSLMNFPGAGLNECELGFYACHFKQFTSDHKIIVTDWSNPESDKPKLDDPNFPVKTIIYFCQSQKHQDEHMCSKIRKFIEDADLSGCGACFFYCHSFTPITVFNQNENERIAMGISIAFLGKNIQSASLKIHDDRYQEIVEKLAEFKQHLTFPSDDERVFAFWLIDRGILGQLRMDCMDHFKVVLIAITKAFPKLKIMPVMGSFLLGTKNEPDITQVLHLIRI